MEHKLDDYQEKAISELAEKLKIHNSAILQSETGSGKTVIFSAITQRYITKSDKNVIIFVHTRELLVQTRRTLMNWYGIVSQKIDAKTKSIEPNTRVYVAMVETFNNRAASQRFLNHFSDIGISIYDEVHRGNFKKLFVHFCDSKRIGVTATPVYSNKKDPLKNYFADIVVGPDIEELIEVNRLNPRRGVVPCITYSLKNINRSDLKVKGEEFDEDFMGEEFSKKKQIQNTIDAYIKYAYGTKAICFNANVKHSLLMHQAFLDNGLNSRHLDGNKGGMYGNDAYREDCFKWLKETPNAILCNVGIATTGFDDPSIETVILNSSMMSLTLYRQKCGRGARPYVYPDGRIKKDFLILDMGDNVVGGGFNQWSDKVDWRFMFENPKIPRPGVAVVKSCPNCGAINFASARICNGMTIDPVTDEEIKCEYVFPIKSAEEDTVFKEMVRITSDGISVSDCIKMFEDRSEYYAMYQLYTQIANLCRKNITSNYLDSEQLDGIFQSAEMKLKEWHKLTGKRIFPNFKAGVRSAMIKELTRVGFIITPAELLELDGVELSDFPEFKGTVSIDNYETSL